MPFPLLPRLRPRLPIGGQLPLGEMSDMPEVAPSRPGPIPLPRPEWHPPMTAPESEPMPQGFHPPMALPPRPEPMRTPPFVPVQMSDARPSIDLQRPQRAPMPDIPIVGGGGATVPDNPYDRARRDYVMEGAKRNPDGSLAGDKLQFKRSGKDIALAALAGLGRGGVIGAATGALTATIDPKTGREMNFEAFHAPQIERAMERGQQEKDRTWQEQARQRQEALQRLALDRGTVGLDQERAQTELYKAQAQKALNPAIPRQQVRLQPMQMADGSVQLVNLEDPANEGKSFSPILKPERRSVADMLKEAEAEREVDEGSPEEIALSSYEGRGGDAYVMSRLPEATRRILNGETVKELVTLKDEFGKQKIEPATIEDANGKEIKNPKAGLPMREMQERPATPAEVQAAQSAYDRAIAAAKAQDLNYTKGEARKKAAGRMGGQSPILRSSGGGRSGGTRSLSELESKYFGGR